MKNKKILIFGGAGFLGTALTGRYYEHNKIINVSRDELKHLNQSLLFNRHANISYIICDIRDKDKVNQTLLRVKPNIVIIASALKHINRCQDEQNECIATNITGIQNILNSVELNLVQLRPNLECVLFISTDKACSPVNVYGMCKAISENLMIEKSKYIPDIKFVCCRYGNVLDSHGSIIPILHSLGKNNAVSKFTLTSKDMTRFVMTVEQSIDLIEYAIKTGNSGEIIIPRIMSCKIIDLFQIFSELYKKPIAITKIRPGEKLLESLVNETQACKLYTTDGKPPSNSEYMHIAPYYSNYETTEFIQDYNSKLNPIEKDELYLYLKQLNLL